MAVKTEYALTVASGMNTLFVTGTPDLQRLLSEALNTGATHIHLGCNGSFRPDKSAEFWEPWDETIFHLLKDDIWVTLEFDSSYGEHVLEAGYTEWDMFIPLIVLDLPYVKQYGHTTTVKLLDSRENNCWYSSLHELTDPAKFVHRTKSGLDNPDVIRYNNNDES